MNYTKKLGAYIRVQRKTNKVTLPDLALAAGISKGGLSKIENGKGNPCLSTIMRISKALEISAGHMLIVSFNEQPCQRDI